MGNFDGITYRGRRLIKRRSERYLSHMTKARNVRMRFMTLRRWGRYLQAMGRPDGTLPVTLEAERIFAMLVGSPYYDDMKPVVNQFAFRFRGVILVVEQDLQIPEWV